MDLTNIWVLKVCGYGGMAMEITATKWLIFLNVLPIKTEILVLNIHMTVQCKHIGLLKLTAQPQQTACANYELTTCYFNSNLLASKHFVCFENEMS